MIVAMKRLRLIAHKQDEADILKSLQEAEAVQVIRLLEEAKADEELDRLEQRGAQLTDSLDAVKPYAKKAGFFTPKREEKLEQIQSKVDEGLKLSRDLEVLIRRRNTLRAEIDKNNSTIAALRPFERFPYEMQSVEQSKHVRCFLGLIASKDLDALYNQDFISVELYGEGTSIAALAACHVDDAKAASTFFKSIDWTDVVFPKLSGTPAEAMAALQARNDEINRELEKLEEELKAFAENADVLQDAADATLIERDRARAATALAKTRSAFVLEGWVREDEAQKAEQAVAAVTDAYSWEIFEPEEDEIPPSVVQNNAFVKPFEQVQTLYSRPDPRGIDGTPFMTPCYILLFGLMLSDAGYGIILSIGAWLYLKFKKPRGMSGGVVRVLFWGGLSTIVWGVLVGTFFGLSLKEEIGLFPLWFDPMTDSMTMLGLCFGLGVIHILFGYILKMKVAFDNKDWQSAIFDALSWILIILGLVLYLVPSLVSGLPAIMQTIGLPMAGLGALLILLFKGRGKKNPLKRTISGLGELYNVSSLLADILSYARLFALGIATGVIAQVFNDLCGMLMGGSNPIMAVLGFIIGCALLVALHLFNIAINTLGAFVHCARLQYVEFYGKFYEAGGREFVPLGYRTKYINVEK
ncbi:MAG: V-type ATP synthase subunit I [Clostridia bacterium]|nr:V-type ATP synthase subunit I [Clostridia bacterium]